MDVNNKQNIYFITNEVENPIERKFTVHNKDISLSPSGSREDQIFETRVSVI